MAEFRHAGLLPASATPLAGIANVREAARLLHAMGNPHRLAVLRELASGERSVTELLRVVGIGQSALSQHLARLRIEGVVRTRRQAQRILYSLDAAAAEAVLRALGHPGPA
ncbi:MAG: helix-turn-helix transcriptional regulator [Magnetospirillum sp.]|nr:helix-turn-helix transcriptional regulator [Magnetospirillum sp.]